MANHETRKCTLYVGNGTPFRVQKQERNAPCICGSGKKSKKCCGEKEEYFTLKKKETNK